MGYSATVMLRASVLSLAVLDRASVLSLAAAFHGSVLLSTYHDNQADNHDNNDDGQR